MRKIFLYLTAILFLTAISLYAQTSGKGAGVMLGEPTGFNGKLWLNETNAIDLGIGWSFIGAKDGFALHADYLYHIDNSEHPNFRFPIYYGFGGRIRTEDGDLGLGFRGVGGLLYYFDNYPADIFLEFAPVFKLLPETALEVDISLGARYYFD